jgi:preprotein translocase subunit YajC
MGGDNWIGTAVFFVALIAIVYFLMIRPEKKRQQDRQRLLDNLKKGDRIVTIGGICGTVTNMRGDDVIVRVDDENEVNIKFIRSAISKIVEPQVAEKDGEEVREKKSK